MKEFRDFERFCHDHIWTSANKPVETMMTLPLICTGVSVNIGETTAVVMGMMGMEMVNCDDDDD